MKLITWNIQRGRGPDNQCSIDRVVADLKRIGPPDILCLQEVSAGYSDLAGLDAENQFISLTRLLPGYTPIAGITTDTLGPAGTRRIFGSMIFSRYPVHQVIRHALPWPADPEVMSMQRGMLEATVDSPCGLIRVATTHLEYFSLNQRMSQVQRLRELQRDAATQSRQQRPGTEAHGPFASVPRGGPALLTGDFNFLPDSLEHQRLQATFADATPAWCDAWKLVHGTLPHAPTVGLRDPDGTPFTFDFVFACQRLAERVYDLQVVSEVAGGDHQPMVLSMR